MGKGKPVPFFEFTRAELEKILQKVRNKEPLTENEIRGFFYLFRIGFMDSDPTITSVTEGSDSTDKFYKSWSVDVLTKFFKDHCGEFGIEKDRYWQLRDLMGIYAKARAICDAEGGNEFLIDHTNRDKVDEKCSFILVCEKHTIAKELVAALRFKGYHVNLVSSAGFDTCDEKEAILSAIDRLENDNFYVAHLHDYDKFGIRMYSQLRKGYDKIIDVGVNRDFLSYLVQRGLLEKKITDPLSLDDLDLRLLEETVTNTTKEPGLEDEMSRLSYGYDSVDFAYLQGKPRPITKHRKSGKAENSEEWIGKRIEIDAIVAKFGIKPIADYIEYCIEGRMYDLTRINIGEQSLLEPENEYDPLITGKESEVRNAYHDKAVELSENLNKILDTVRDTITMPHEYSELKDKYLQDGILGKNIVKAIDPLTDKYFAQIHRDWTDDYADELNEQVNDKLTCWDGKLATAESDINDIVGELQDRLDEDKANDEDLAGFKEKLDQVDWGKDELEKIPIPDPAEEVRKVICALLDYLKELENY